METIQIMKAKKMASKRCFTHVRTTPIKHSTYSTEKTLFVPGNVHVT